MIEIRQAESTTDIAAARQLFEEYAQSLGFSLCFQGFEKELANLPGEYAAPKGRLLLAYWEGKLAGCVALHAFGKSGACEMKRLYVRPEFRGRHIGKHLLNAVLRAAREIGYRQMLLDTVGGKMDRAIALYRDYGFKEIPAYRENPQPGVIYMELELVPTPSSSP